MGNLLAPVGKVEVMVKGRDMGDAGSEFGWKSSHRVRSRQAAGAHRLGASVHCAMIELCHECRKMVKLAEVLKDAIADGHHVDTLLSLLPSLTAGLIKDVLGASKLRQHHPTVKSERVAQ